jgi:IS5 family transposase
MPPTAVLPELLHGNETRVWGDQAYRGRRAMIREDAPNARDFTNRRYRHRGVVDEVERAKNRANPKCGPGSSIRSGSPSGCGFAKVAIAG